MNTVGREIFARDTQAIFLPWNFLAGLTPDWIFLSILFRRKASGKNTNPVDKVEQDEHERDDVDHDLLHRFSSGFFAQSHAVEHEGEFKENEKDENDAHQHPHVKEAYVADLQTNRI